MPDTLHSDATTPGSAGTTAAGASYRFTFGHFSQKTAWTDVRSLTWPETVDLLTAHAYGPKEGTCIVPAVFRGTRRHKAEADRIEVAFLDSDSGMTLPEISHRITARGWQAIISSTHSHMTTTTVAKVSNWEKFCRHDDEPMARAERFLIEEKGYLARVAAGAHIAGQTGDYITFEHQPCPKFRIVLPLLRPWRAQDYRSQIEANASWKERIESVAAALTLAHDQSCTDTSRLFYLPRRPDGGPEPETAYLLGTSCNLFSLPSSRTTNGTTASEPGGRRRQSRQRPDRQETTFRDPHEDTELDLIDWARSYAGRFEIVTALRARKPAVFTGLIVDRTKHHLKCINEGAHTQAGTDAASFCVNASQSTSKGFAIHCRHAHCDGRDRLAFLRQMLEEGWLKAKDLTDPDFLSPDDNHRPKIQVGSGEVAATVDAAEAALMEAGIDLYQRGSFLVRPGIVSTSSDAELDTSVQRIFEVGDYALAEMMAQAAVWEKYDARSRSWTRIDVPLKIATTYKQRVGHWKLPVLAGIINAPTLRRDGSLLAKPGYDTQTGLLVDFRGQAFPRIPNQPTQTDAVASLAVLDELLNGFAFAEPVDKAVAVSAILTSVVRRSLATAPMHANTAPVAGSGKSMLVDVISLIATGRPAGVISQGKTEEELEKRLGSLLLEGCHVIAIDNCEAPLGGEFLSAMLTQASVRPRVLGRSEVPELPSGAMVTATGNNLVLVGDLTRRAIMCRLDPQHERPELRTFENNPTKLLRRDRGRYVAAALTILRAYHVAGRPNSPPELGSFADWSNWVRGALLWLERPDPAQTIDSARDLDPRLQVMSQAVV